MANKSNPTNQIISIPQGDWQKDKFGASWQIIPEKMSKMMAVGARE